MKNNNIDRREFLKKAGSSALVIGGLGAVAGCKGNSSAAPGATAKGAEGAGDMTYRTNSVRGD